jgi:hypothetical protein
MEIVMKKYKLAAIVAALTLAISTFTTPSMAVNIGIGISGAYTDLETDGTETLKTSSAQQSTSVDTVVNIPSIFIQLEMNGWVLGIDHIPGEAELGATKTTRGDQLKGTAEAARNVDQIVQAEISDHNTYYIETPGFGFGDGNGLYLMAGYTEFDVATNETLGTGAAYPDASIDGTTLGIGVKQTFDNGIFVKAIATHTDYDDISLASTGSDASSTIDASIESTAAKFALGYNF